MNILAGLLAFIAVGVIGAIIQNFLDRRRDTKDEELRQKFLEARNEREYWEQVRGGHRDHQFNNPEYQELWMAELGAADMYEQFARSPYKVFSRQEYARKEREALAAG